METFEGRVLFAFTPTVADVNPANNATNVFRDQFIGCDVNLSGVGVEVDGNTLNGHVTLATTNGNVAVSGTVKTSGGGDSIVFSPLSILQANTEYTFTVTSGVKDTAGEAFATFTPASPATGTKSNSVPTRHSASIRSLCRIQPGHQYTQRSLVWP